MPGQLALHAGRELVHVRHFEVRVRGGRPAAEERQRTEGAPRRRVDAIGEGIAQDVGGRAATVIGRDQRRRLAEPVGGRLGRGVEEVLAVAAAHDRLLVDLVGGAGASLPVVPVELGGRLRRAVDVQELDAAHDGLADASRDRVDDGRVERVVHPVLLFVNGTVEVPAEAEIQRQLAVDAPVVLDPGRDEVPVEVREQVDRHVAARRRAEQERRPGVPFHVAGAVDRAAGERAGEVDLAAGVAVVVVVNVGAADVEAAADIVGAAVHRDVRLDAEVLVGVRSEAARQLHELVERDDREQVADGCRRQLRHQARRPPERGRVEAERGVGLAAFEIVGITGAQVEDRAAAENVHPVADERVVAAEERQLAVLRRAGADGGGIAHFVARVLAPAEERAVLAGEVVVDLADPVPEHILVEVLVVAEVLLPVRLPRRRAVRVGEVLHHRLGGAVEPARRDDVAGERIARPDAVDVVAGERIVDPDQVT